MTAHKKPGQTAKLRDPRDDEATALAAVKEARRTRQLPRLKARLRAFLAAPRAAATDPAWVASSLWVIGRGSGSVAKFSPNGKFIGWYRHNQRAGKPSSKHQIERELATIEEGIRKALRSGAQRFYKQAAQRKSLLARGQVRAKVLALYVEYLRTGVDEDDITAAIAAKVNRSRRTIQRILKSPRTYTVLSCTPS
jgi:hypothetical protein